MRSCITMKEYMTVTIDKEILKILKNQKEETGASISYLVNKILKKEFKLK